METQAQRVERLKREQNPWEELPRLFSAMRAGAGAIAPADLNLRLRWWGLYTQGDGEGAFGDAAPFFMLRIRIPNGLLTAKQTAGIAALTRQYARGVADVTVRQNIQLHWLDAETLPDVFHRLWDLGLTSQAACGDDPRNLTGCPLAGLDPAEHADASRLLLEANRALLASGDYYNLPRKFKVCISGCRDWCANPEINDVALTAFPPDGGAGKARFGLRVGGGLSSSPMLAQALPVRVAWDQVVPVVAGIARLFREQDGLRQNRAYARLKFLFLKQGWTAERFVEELEARLGFALERGAPDEPPRAGFRDHIGVHAQKQAGLYWVGVTVLRGRLSAGQLDAIAEAAERHGGGEVRATAMQNLLLPHVPERNLADVRTALERAGLPVEGSAFRRGTLSCTGKEFCKLAVTETKRFASELIVDLERRMPGFPLPLRINLNGCPNSCGQHWIADVGLQGTRVRTPAGPADGFDVYLGGGLGADARLARRTLGRVLATELPERLEHLFRYYLAQRQPNEDFRYFVEREGTALEKVLGTLPAAEVLIKLREEFVPAVEEA